MAGVPVKSLEGMRVKPLSLRANFSWTFAGNLIYAASQWGILVVLAKLGSPEMVGQFALGLAIGAPVIMFANLQLRAVQATDAQREYRFGDYFGLRLLTTLGALALIVGIILASGYAQETALVIFFIGLAKAFESISDIFFGLLQQHERMDRIAKSLMIEGPVTLLVVGVVIALTRNLVLATAAMALAWFVQLVLYDFRSGWLILRAGVGEAEARARIRPRFEGASLRRLAWLALPLGLAGSFGALTINVPRYFLESAEGVEALGIFAANAYLLTVGTLVINALGQSASPRLASLYSMGDLVTFRNLLLKLLGLGTFLGLTGVAIVLIAGDSLLTLLYGSQYAMHADVLLILMMAATIQFMYVFLGTALKAARKFMMDAYSQAISLALVFVMSALLIPRFGMYAAALVILIKAVLEAGIYVSRVMVTLNVRRLDNA